MIAFVCAEGMCVGAVISTRLLMHVCCSVIVVEESKSISSAVN